MIHVMTNDYFIYLDLDHHIRLAIKRNNAGWDFKAVQNINIDHRNPMDVELDGTPSIIVSGSIYGGIHINDVTVHRLHELVLFNEARNAVFSIDPMTKDEAIKFKSNKHALNLAKKYILNLSKRTKFLLRDWLHSDEYYNPNHYSNLLPKIKAVKNALNKLSNKSDTLRNRNRYNDKFDQLDYLTCGFNI